MSSSFYFCLCDISGQLIFISPQLEQLLSLDHKASHIFDIDEDYSKSRWKEHMSVLEIKKSMETERAIGSDVKKISVEATYLFIEEQGRSLIAINYKNQEVKTHARNLSVAEPSDRAPNEDLVDIQNAVHYLAIIDNNGHIISVSNKISADYVSPSEAKPVSIVDLFIEYQDEDILNDLNKSQLGQTVERRLIYRGANRKFIDGFGTILCLTQKSTSRFLFFFRPHELIHSLQQEITTLKDQLKESKETLAPEDLISISQPIEEFKFENIITTSPKYKAILALIAQVADTDTTVLITGETGTGKELLANAIYKLSDREGAPFIKLNCAVFAKELIESTLFGHEKGAFTGATEQKIGYFEKAHKGTIFLDEVGELTPALQVRLLRVLQSGEFMRVGGTQIIKVDVRVIAATNRDLPLMIKNKKFRQDLYYRLNVFPVHNIPLRERKEDIPLLVDHFMKKFSKKMGKQITKIRTGDLKKLQRYQFPGNIRELENMIERATILSKDKVLALFQIIRATHQNAAEDDFFDSLEEAQKKHIKKALKLCKGKVTGKDSAAELLKINGKTLVSRMKKLGINK